MKQAKSSNGARKIISLCPLRNKTPLFGTIFPIPHPNPLFSSQTFLVINRFLSQFTIDFFSVPEGSPSLKIFKTNTSDHDPTRFMQ